MRLFGKLRRKGGNGRALKGSQLVPVSADATARRMLCLYTVIERAKLEPMAAHAAGDRRLEGEMEKAAQQLREWLRAKGLWRSLSTRERGLFGQIVGRWREQDVLDAAWRAEAMHTLGWALGICASIPPYDEASGGDNSPLRGLPPRADEVLASPQLRSHDVIAGARDIAEFWLWRSRTLQLQKWPPVKVDLPPGMTFEEIVRVAAEGGEQEGRFTRIGGDFPALGKAYRDLDEEEWSYLNSIACERLYALNWLVGDSDDWDEVPLST